MTEPILMTVMKCTTGYVVVHQGDTYAVPNAFRLGRKVRELATATEAPPVVAPPTPRPEVFGKTEEHQAILSARTEAERAASNLAVIVKAEFEGDIDIERATHLVEQLCPGLTMDDFAARKNAMLQSLAPEPEPKPVRRPRKTRQAPVVEEGGDK